MRKVVMATKFKQDFKRKKKVNTEQPLKASYSLL